MKKEQNKYNLISFSNLLWTCTILGGALVQKNVEAADCEATKNCDALGYIYSESQCAYTKLECPFDSSKFFCARNNSSCEELGFKEITGICKNITVSCPTTPLTVKCEVYTCEDFHLDDVPQSGKYCLQQKASFSENQIPSHFFSSLGESDWTITDECFLCRDYECADGGFAEAPTAGKNCPPTTYKGLTCYDLSDCTTTSTGGGGGQPDFSSDSCASPPCW